MSGRAQVSIITNLFQIFLIFFLNRLNKNKFVFDIEEEIEDLKKYKEDIGKLNKEIKEVYEQY